jgi:hypothetical protein
MNENIGIYMLNLKVDQVLDAYWHSRTSLSLHVVNYNDAILGDFICD